VTDGEAVGISENLGVDGVGQIACTLNGPGFSGQRAFVLDDDTWFELPPQSGGLHSGAAGMSSVGSLGGYRDVGFIRHVFRWQSGTFEMAPPPLGSQAIPRGVSSNSMVAGYLLDSTNRAFWWHGSEVIDLGPVLHDGVHAIAETINIRGVVGGNTGFDPSAKFPFGTNRGWIWRDGVVVTLDSLDDSGASQLLAMNDLGQVIVTTFDPRGGADNAVIYLWQHGMATQLAVLHDAPPNYLFAGPVSMNAQGQIAFSFFVGGSNHFVGAVLTPIDRPLGDVNCDCIVDTFDITDVLRDWGPCFGPGAHPSDIVNSDTLQPPGDGKVDGADLAVVIGNWSQPADPRSVSRGR